MSSDSEGLLIIFIEQRNRVFEIYRDHFKKGGENITKISDVDFIDWISTCKKSELISIEAVLIGQCDDASGLLACARQKLNVPMIAMLETRCLKSLVEFYRCGVDDVVIKPIHFDELSYRFAAIKRRILGNDVPKLSKTNAGKIAIYFDGRDPEYDSGVLTLPRRERRILEFLATTNGRRVSKSQIFNAVYGAFDETTDETIVESHISKLRKKLRTKIGFDPIDSKRFLGYRLDPSAVSVQVPVRSAQVA